MLRFIPGPNYTRGHRAFGTPYIASGVYNEMGYKIEDSVVSFMEEVKDEAACQSLAGVLFEQRACHNLNVGGSFATFEPNDTGALSALGVNKNI